MRHRYGRSRSDIRALVAALLDARELVFEDESEVSSIVSDATQGDLADHFISCCAQRAGCTSTVTFDSKAAEAIPAMELLA